MKNFLLLIILLSFAESDLYCQEVNFEQKATNILLDSIFLKEYESNKAEFSGYTETKNNMFLGIFDAPDIDKISNSQKYKSKSIDIESDKVRLKKHWIGNVPNIFVYSVMLYQGFNYVYVKVFNKNHYVGHHLFKFDSKGNLESIQTETEII